MLYVSVERDHSACLDNAYPRRAPVPSSSAMAHDFAVLEHTEQSDGLSDVKKYLIILANGSSSFLPARNAFFVNVPLAHVDVREFGFADELWSSQHEIFE